MSTSIWRRPRLLLSHCGRAVCLRRPSRRLGLFVRNHFRKWCVDDELVVPTYGGFRMAVSPKDYISYGIYFFGQYDPPMSGVVSHFVREGQTVWDVGTERGWFTLLMASLVGKTGRVDAFEAFPPTVEKLQANVALNQMDWVRVNGVAVSETEGKMWFVPPSDAVTQHIGFLEHHRGVGYLTDAFQPGAMEIPTISLDQYAEQTGIKHLHFIKMDIEGAEVPALRGACQVVRRWRPMLAVEYNRLTAQRAGSSVEELDDLLDSYGYDRFVFEGRFARLDLKKLDDQPDEEAVWNVYCFPKEERVTG